MTEGGVFTSLGINPVYLVSQIISVSVLIFLLTKFLYKPILQKLDERSKLVKEGAKAAEKSLQKQEEIEADRDRILAKTQKEVEAIIAKAKGDATLTKDEIVKQAKDEASKLMDKKQNEIKEMLADQEKQLSNKMVDLSVEVSRKVLQDYFGNQKTQNQILKAQLKKLAQTKVQ